jgi:regulator of replication initiation timing
VLVWCPRLQSDVEQVGFVAQEVQKVFPEAVNEGEDGLLDFNMHPVNVALVNAIKELKAENDRLKAENEKINARLDKIEGFFSLKAEKSHWWWFS